MTRFLRTMTLILLAASCSDSTSPFSNLSANNNADDFLFVAQTFDRTVTATLHYDWPHTGTVARVGLGTAVQGVGTTTPLSGSASITIHDGSGKQVYAHSLTDNLLDTTAAGTAGTWGVDLVFSGVRGDAVAELVKAPRDLIVTTTTSGTNLSPNGYSVAVDGGTSQSISNNGSAPFSNLSAASHTVVLSSVPANCSVTGGNARMVTVPATIPTTVAFSITCA